MNGEPGNPVTDGSLVQSSGDHAAASGSLDGAGVFSSFGDMGTAWESRSPEQILYTHLGALLDAVGAVMSPLDALGEAGFGWLIEHIGFLHEALDALAGDPVQISAQAQTWHNVAEQLGAVATSYRSGKPDRGQTGWDGEALAAYNSAVDDYTDRLTEVGRAATDFGNLILVNGAAVGTVRSLIRDLIAWFAWEAIKWIISVLATGAVLLINAVLGITLDATRLGTRIADRISALLTDLQNSGDVAKTVVSGMRHVRESPSLDAIESYAEQYPAAEMIEWGKQQSGVRESQRNWDEPAATPT